MKKKESYLLNFPFFIIFFHQIKRNPPNSWYKLDGAHSNNIIKTTKPNSSNELGEPKNFWQHLSIGKLSVPFLLYSSFLDIFIITQNSYFDNTYLLTLFLYNITISVSFFVYLRTESTRKHHKCLLSKRLLISITSCI